jgi:hypothetical protein
MNTKKLDSLPNTRLPLSRKPAHLRPFSALSLGQRCPSHCPGRPGPIPAQPEAILGSSGSGLGPPLGIREAAAVIGCSPWTVRQKLLPRGLPYLRFGASGKLIFYRDQIVRWIEFQQQGG